MEGAEQWRESRRELLDDLERIAKALRQRARALVGTMRDPDLRGIVISDQEFDQLLDGSLGQSLWSALEPAGPPETGYWAWFARRFELEPAERAIILVGLLPEVDASFERIFGYLQDNVTLRRPSVDLVLRLLATRIDEQLALRRLFRPEATLLRRDLLRLQAPDAPDHGLANQRLVLNPLVVEHLLDPTGPPAPRHPALELVAPSTSSSWSLPVAAQRLVAHPWASGPWLQIEVRYPELARQVAAEAAKARKRPLLLFNADKADDLPVAARAAALEATLRDAILLITGLGADLPEVEHRARLDALSDLLREVSTPVFWHCSLQLPLQAPPGVPTATLHLDSPDYDQRLNLWRNSLDAGASAAPAALETAAARYRLAPEQIAWAGRTAVDAASLCDDPSAELGFADLAQAARRASSRDIGQLARRLPLRHGWDDLVLPADRIAQLREMCDQLTYRHIVMEQWGYGRQSGAPGLSALFAGPSGTGKTMAAEVVAGELGLDLYRIDLSGVVSKYIGETEKNLERIFSLARDSNAILLFDEADALFGKRSETRDAHDRYANIEVSYLLQKIEEYDGLVILTSNLRQNLDEAFMRRLQVAVDFPFPDAQARLAIWQRLITAKTPTGPLDLEMLARRYRLSGGSIRNVILTAAFLAARDGAPLDTDYMIWAIRREYQKLGRLVDAGEFGGSEQWHARPLQRELSDG